MIWPVPCTITTHGAQRHTDFGVLMRKAYRSHVDGYPISERKLRVLVSMRRRFHELKAYRSGVLGKPTLYGLYHWLPYRVGYHAMGVPSGLYGSHHQVIECLDRIELHVDVIKPLLACSPIARFSCPCSILTGPLLALAHREYCLS